MTANSISRRAMIRGAAGLSVAAAAAPLFAACGKDNERVAVQGPTETPTIRMPKTPLTFDAAQAVAADFLKEEGFTDVQFVTLANPVEIFSRFANNEFDMMGMPAPLLPVRIEAGD